MHVHEWHFFDKNKNQIIVTTDEEEEYVAGEYKHYNGKSYKIIWRLIDRYTTNNYFLIAVEE